MLSARQRQAYPSSKQHRLFKLTPTELKQHPGRREGPIQMELGDSKCSLLLGSF